MMKLKRGEYFPIFIIFLILFGLLTKTGAISWNDQSRMAQIQALVEYSSFSIDQTDFSLTGDKYLFNGHFYSDKPPILALYASPVYFVLKQLGFSFGDHEGLIYYWLTLISLGMLSLLGLLVFRKIIREFFQVSCEWADLVTFIAGAGTLVLPYSLIFNNHLPSGIFILLSVYFFLDFSRKSSLMNAIFSGVFISLAGTIDINCFLFIPFIMLPLLRKSLKAGLVFGLACLPPIALYLFLNVYTSGSLMPPAMNAPLWNYPGSNFNQENLSGLAHHQNILDVLIYAFNMVLGRRGLFSYTPILLLSLFSILAIYFGKLKFQYKQEYGYILLAMLLYIAIYIFRTTNYSGWAFGVRWFVSLMLILCLPIACLEHEIRASKTIRTCFFGVVILSILISIIGTSFPFSPLPVNFRFVLKTLPKVLLMRASIKEEVGIMKMILSTLIIYLSFYRFAKKLEPLPLSNKCQ